MANYAFDLANQAQSFSGSSRTPDYSHLLKQAQGQYQGILQGYQQAIRGQQRAQQQTMGGYNRLQANVLGGLAGAGTARSQEIADLYTQRAGEANQNLISRGLGNTTVAASVGARYTGDQAKQQTLLANELAGTTAQYQSQLGLAGLGYRNQAIQQRTGLQNQRLGYMGDYQRSLGDWATRGLQMQYSGRGGGGYGGRGGLSGGGGGMSIGSGDPYGDRLSAQNYYAQPNANEPMINVNAFGGYGGFNQRPQTTYIGNQWEHAPITEYGNETPGYTYDWSGE